MFSFLVYYIFCGAFVGYFSFVCCNLFVGPGIVCMLKNTLLLNYLHLWLLKQILALPIFLCNGVPYHNCIILYFEFVYFVFSVLLGFCLPVLR